MKDALKITRKELREIIRDKRVRNAVTIMPMFVIFMMLSLFGFIGQIAGKAENQHLVIVGKENSLAKDLTAAKFDINYVATLDDATQLIRNGKANLALQFEPNYDQLLSDQKPAHIDAYFDDKETKGQIALSIVSKTVGELNKSAVKTVLTKHGVDASMSEPITVREKPIKVGESNVSEILISILPYMITIYAFFGGLASGSELVAGEKEKNTLETLLITPVKRSDIAIGKFLALCAVCIAGSLSALLGVIIAGSSGMSIFHTVFPNGLGLGPGQIGAIILTLIPTVAFFASLLLAVSTKARNTREAQQYYAVVNLVVLMPAIFSQVIGFTDLASQRWIDFVPVLNTSVTLRQALQGKLDPVGMGITVLMGLVLAAIGITIAVRLFQREQVLVRV